MFNLSFFSMKKSIVKIFQNKVVLEILLMSSVKCILKNLPPSAILRAKLSSIIAVVIWSFSLSRYLNLENFFPCLSGLV
jgi:hypothetical protein